MKTFNLSINGLRHRTLAAFAVCGLIIAAAQGFALRVHAEEAKADYAAPLDMTSTYADPLYGQYASARHPMVMRDTTGIASEPIASDRKDAAASLYSDDETNSYPGDAYKFTP